MTTQQGNAGFGTRVVGKDNYDKAVRENKGGGNVFGKRVRDSITEAGPVGEKKRNTEHGPLVVAGATASDNRGKVTDGVSIDQIRNILAENPTFFDSLYEAELARPEGARPDALEIFLQVEIGIKGAGRSEIIGEIRGLLGEKKVTSAQVANENRLRLQQREEMQQRTEENALLADADRVRSLARREEDLALVKKSRASKTDQTADRALMMDSQRRETADREGIDIGDGSGTSGRIAHPRTPSKPEGDTNPESQQPGNRLGVPDGADGGSGSSGGDGGSGGSGGGQGGGSGENEDDEGAAEEKRLNKLTVKQLNKEAKKAGVDTDEIEGTGADGAVLKKDLVAAILAKQGEEK